MIAPSSRFAPRSDQDVVRLVLDHPLAWVVSGEGADFRATLLPIRPVYEPNGPITSLVGHFARSNDHSVLLKHNPRALILFLGPQGYISPSWMQDKTQAPTWNYASVQFQLELIFRDEPDHADAALRDLVEGMEADRPGRWRIEEMGQRYTGLSRGVVAFDAKVLRAEPKYKLGQDEREDVYDDIVAGLEAEGTRDLVDWMRLYNRGRKRND